MTRVLVYEWCCSGAAREEYSRAASLWSEGWAMLAAALQDFCRVPGVEVRTILDARLRSEPAVMGQLPPIIDRGLNVIWADDEECAFRAAAADADFALIIAPEFDRILETRCRWAVDAGATFLGPSPEAVALTADKLELGRHLARCGVVTPETMPLLPTDPSRKRERRTVNTVAYASGSDWSIAQFVVKPRFGVGSQETCLVAVGDSLPETGPFAEMVAQPFVPGEPASVVFLIGPRETIALMPAWQHISDDGRFHYRGGSIPLPPDRAVRAVRIARQAIDAVPGLSGYVGVDVILGVERDHVIEINPRLTTSYVGLRAATETNLMHTLLEIVRGESPAKPQWRSRAVSWTADGEVTTTDLPTT